MSLINMIMTTLGDSKKLEAPTVTEDTSNVTETSIAVIISDYVGPGTLTSVDITVTKASDGSAVYSVTYGAYTKKYAKSSLTKGTEYNVKVKYTNSQGKSIESTILTVKTVTPPPKVFSWQPSAETNVSGYNAVEAGLGLFVAVGDNNLIRYSDDGKTWNTPTSSTANKSWIRLAFGNDRFIAMAADGSLITSIDGKNWADMTTPIATGKTFTALNFITLNGIGSFVAADSSYNIYQSTSNLNIWDIKASVINHDTKKIKTFACGAINGTDYVVTVTGQRTYGIAYTTNLVDWLYVDVGTDHTAFELVSYGLGYFMTTCSGGHSVAINTDAGVFVREAFRNTEAVTADGTTLNVGSTWTNNKFVGGMYIMIPTTGTGGFKTKFPGGGKTGMSEKWFSDKFGGSATTLWKDITFGPDKNGDNMFVSVANNLSTISYSYA